MHCRNTVGDYTFGGGDFTTVPLPSGFRPGVAFDVIVPTCKTGGSTVVGCLANIATTGVVRFRTNANAEFTGSNDNGPFAFSASWVQYS